MQFITISILVVITSQVNADGNNTTILCPYRNYSNDTLQFSIQKYHNFSLVAKWFIYIINATVLLAGCFGNFIVIYALGIQKKKVPYLIFFFQIHVLFPSFYCSKQHFNNIF